MNISKEKVEAILRELHQDVGGICCESEAVVLIERGVVISFKATSLRDYEEENGEPEVYKGGIAD